MGRGGVGSGASGLVVLAALGVVHGDAVGVWSPTATRWASAVAGWGPARRAWLCLRPLGSSTATRSGSGRPRRRGGRLPWRGGVRRVGLGCACGPWGRPRRRGRGLVAHGDAVGVCRGGVGSGASSLGVLAALGVAHGDAVGVWSPTATRWASAERRGSGASGLVVLAASGSGSGGQAAPGLVGCAPLAEPARPPSGGCAPRTRAASAGRGGSGPSIPRGGCFLLVAAGPCVGDARFDGAARRRTASIRVLAVVRGALAGGRRAVAAEARPGAGWANDVRRAAASARRGRGARASREKPASW